MPEPRGVPRPTKNKPEETPNGRPDLVAGLEVARDVEIEGFQGGNVEDSDAARLSAEVSGQVSSALCPHAAGPPVCWCRPPLPGLILAFARMHDIDPSRSTLIGSGPAHRTLATTLGADYVPV